MFYCNWVVVYTDKLSWFREDRCRMESIYEILILRFQQQHKKNFVVFSRNTRRHYKTVFDYIVILWYIILLYLYIMCFMGLYLYVEIYHDTIVIVHDFRSNCWLCACN